MSLISTGSISLDVPLKGKMSTEKNKKKMYWNQPTTEESGLLYWTEHRQPTQMSKETIEIIGPNKSLKPYTCNVLFKTFDKNFYRRWLSEMDDDRFPLNDKMRVDKNAHKIGKSPFQIGLWILYLLLLTFSFSVSEEIRKTSACSVYRSILQK